LQLFALFGRLQPQKRLQLSLIPLNFVRPVTPANVVDHVTPHKGDWTDFITGGLRSLCEPCLNSAKRQIELRGYRCDIGLDGFPTDPNHPFNRAR
jgi:hypothetical protein